MHRPIRIFSVPNGCSTHAHGLRVLIEPLLRGLDNVFVLPAFDAALVGRCALIFARTWAARLGQAIFISGEVVSSFSPAGRCAIVANCDLSVPRLVTSCATIRWFVVSTALHIVGDHA
jgi:hypothetical protein